MPVPQALPSRRSRLAVAALTTTVLGAALGAGSAQAMQAEQISRADGVAGASPIEFHSAPGVVSDDGTTAYVNFSVESGPWATATGLWRRDVVTNRSTQILGGTGTQFAGFGATNDVIGLTTSKRLNSADTNNASDLYTYTHSTRSFALVSRIGSGAAIGVGGAGFLTRNGTAALFSNAAGTYRRDLATGQTVKVADGQLGSYSARDASADGSVFATQAGSLVSPSGTRALIGQDSYGPNVAVSADGRWAAVKYTRASDGKELGFYLDVATGARKSFTPAALGIIIGFSDDGRVLVGRSTSDTTFQVAATTLPSGASTRVATFGAPITSLHALSRSARFAVFTTSGPSYVGAADGVDLPGGTDLPSPGIFISASSACRASGWPWYRPAQAPILARTYAPPWLGQPTSLALRVTNASGGVVSNTVIPGTSGVWPYLPAGGAFGLTLTATYPGGRTATESWTLPAPTRVCDGI